MGPECPSRSNDIKILTFLTFQRLLCQLMRGRFSLSPSLSEEFLCYCTVTSLDRGDSLNLSTHSLPTLPTHPLRVSSGPRCWDKTTEKLWFCPPRIFPAPCLHAHKPSSLFMSSRMLGILSGVTSVCDAVGCWLWLELFVKADN